MRVFTARRFALSLGVLALVGAVADSAQAQLLRGRAARRNAVVYSAPVATVATVDPCYQVAGGYVQPTAYPMPMPTPPGPGQPTYAPSSEVIYTQPTYSPAVYASDSAVSYRAPRFRLFRGMRSAQPVTYTYAQPMYYPSGGAYPAGYMPGSTFHHSTSGYTPGSGIPAPLPSTVTPTDASTVTIGISDNVFEPASKTITPGTTVKWTNNGKKPHTVTSDKGDWGSPELAPGQTFTATFTKAGEFSYHCKLHPEMKATISVK
jgi:plastocyanin